MVVQELTYNLCYKCGFCPSVLPSAPSIALHLLRKHGTNILLSPDVYFTTKSIILPPKSAWWTPVNIRKVSVTIQRPFWTAADFLIPPRHIKKEVDHDMSIDEEYADISISTHTNTNIKNEEHPAEEVIVEEMFPAPRIISVVSLASPDCPDNGQGGPPLLKKIKGEILSCPSCRYTARKPSSLNRHLEKVHKGDQSFSSFSCGTCSRHFASLVGLKQHKTRLNHHHQENIENDVKPPQLLSNPLHNPHKIKVEQSELSASVQIQTTSVGATKYKRKINQKPSSHSREVKSEVINCEEVTVDATKYSRKSQKIKNQNENVVAVVATRKSERIKRKRQESPPPFQNDVKPSDQELQKQNPTPTTSTSTKKQREEHEEHEIKQDQTINEEIRIVPIQNLQDAPIVPISRRGRKRKAPPGQNQDHPVISKLEIFEELNLTIDNAENENAPTDSGSCWKCEKCQKGFSRKAKLSSHILSCGVMVKTEEDDDDDDDIDPPTSAPTKLKLKSDLIDWDRVRSSHNHNHSANITIKKIVRFKLDHEDDDWCGKSPTTIARKRGRHRKGENANIEETSVKLEKKSRVKMDFDGDSKNEKSYTQRRNFKLENAVLPPPRPLKAKLKPPPVKYSKGDPFRKRTISKEESIRLKKEAKIKTEGTAKGISWIQPWHSEQLRMSRTIWPEDPHPLNISVGDWIGGGRFNFNHRSLLPLQILWSLELAL